MVNTPDHRRLDNVGSRALACKILDAALLLARAERDDALRAALAGGHGQRAIARAADLDVARINAIVHGEPRPAPDFPVEVEIVRLLAALASEAAA